MYVTISMQKYHLPIAIRVHCLAMIMTLVDLPQKGEETIQQRPRELPKKSLHRNIDKFISYENACFVFRIFGGKYEGYK